MAIYAVLANGTGSLVSAALARAYPEDYHRWGNDTFFLRTSDKPIMIGAALGVMTKDQSGDISGTINHAAIFEVRSFYWGFADPNLWSWLKAAFERDAL